MRNSLKQRTLAQLVNVFEIGSAGTTADKPAVKQGQKAAYGMLPISS